MKTQLLSDLNIWPARFKVNVNLDYIGGFPSAGLEAAKRPALFGDSFLCGEYSLLKYTVYNPVKKAYGLNGLRNYGFWITKENLYDLIDEGFIEVL